MKKLIVMLLWAGSTLAQPWTSNSVCDLTNGTQWNNGGATPCACTWYSVNGSDTILNCAYGDCGQSDLFECVYDCNGHNGNPTDMVPRTCDATASPICWYQGAGSTAGADFCAGIALSIELVDFWGVSVGSNNELYWSTSSEIDNDYFEISYSTEGYNFEVLTNVNGSGNSSQLLNYRFIHTNPKIGVGYYKIKQVDYNGESEEFPIISINNNIINTPYIFTDVYPNPSSNIFYFNYTGKLFNQPITIRLMNSVGSVLLDGVIEKFNDSQSIPFKLMGISKGYYVIEIIQGEHRETKKIMVK
jgi:hypothetical protein